MKISAQVFTAPKRGNDPSEYEDACFPPRTTEIEGEVARFAVADGATETAYSKLWARILVRAYGLGWLDDLPEPKRLPRLRRLWTGRVPRGDLPWHLEEKLRLGSFAAFLGLTVTKSTVRFVTWAIGDCCMAHVRRGELLRAFPIEKAAEFNNRPRLLSTREEANADLAKDLRRLEGDREPGDEFYLMTDALACWFLEEKEAGRAPWDVLRGLSPETFPEWLAARRADRSMRNDDVTLVRIESLIH